MDKDIQVLDTDTDPRLGLGGRLSVGRWRFGTSGHAWLVNLGLHTCSSEATLELSLNGSYSGPYIIWLTVLQCWTLYTCPYVAKSWVPRRCEGTWLMSSQPVLDQRLHVAVWYTHRLESYDNILTHVKAMYCTERLGWVSIGSFRPSVAAGPWGVAEGSHWPRLNLKALLLPTGEVFFENLHGT